MQSQLLVEKQQKIEDSIKDSIEDTIHLLSDPFLLFVKLPKNIYDIKNMNIIYWFAYSAGKSKNMFWGIYRTKSKKFLAMGMCHYDRTSRLHETVIQRMNRGYVNISQQTKNIEFLRIGGNDINRNDMLGKYSGNQYKILQDMSDKFLHYIETKSEYLKQLANVCLMISDCTMQDEFNKFGYENMGYEKSACDQFYYGTETTHEDDESII